MQELQLKITLDGIEHEVDAGSVGEGIKIIREQQEATAKGFLSVQEMTIRHEQIFRSVRFEMVKDSNQNGA